ncbi:MAG: LysM peptidoglycan-binding domain-containing protein [Firmicutes bacterium]|nr:LysM peptidoglycan-binding domain-containing protein [Bacillota bacterium]
MPKSQPIFRLISGTNLKLGLATASAIAILGSTPAYAAVHTVVPGETLWTISRHYAITVSFLQSTNGLEDTIIYPGQKLIVPDKKASAAEAALAAAVADNNDEAVSETDTVTTDGTTEATESEESGLEVTYTVVKGDTLYGIGQKYGVTAEAIMATNNLATTEIHPGQVLVIPKPPSEETRTGVSSRGEAERSERATSLLDIANSLKGKPYRYGASGPEAFDCSGFTAYVFAQAGKDLPHNSASQFNLGQAVQKDDLEPGDLVFFGYYGSRDIRHVGIYTGGNMFIHASTSGGVKYSSMAEGYYAKNYKGAKRIL